MESVSLILPKPVAQLPFRCPQANIPQTYAERNLIKQQIATFVAEKKIVPPIPVDELRTLADHFVAVLQIGRMASGTGKPEPEFFLCDMAQFVIGSFDSD